MSDNILTPAEIEALLGQVAPSNSRGGNTNISGTADAIGGFVKNDQTHQLSTAERKRRNRMWAIHEQAARDAGVALSAMLRAAVDVRLTGVDMLACRSFAVGMETPTCVCLLRSPSLPGQLVLEMSPAILLPMLDRMLGGTVDATLPATNRRLSEIEQRLAMRLGSCVAGELNRDWESTYTLALAVERVETDARWLTIGPPDSEAVVVSFDVRLGKARGTLRFGVPPQAMDVLERQLLAEARVISGPHRMGKAVGTDATDQTELTVELSPSPTTAEDIANLSVGDVIATEHRIDSPVIVNLDGEPKFLGRLGATAGRKTVRIERPTDT
jgi:flagellar motor switch protein FliM